MLWYEMGAINDAVVNVIPKLFGQGALAKPDVRIVANYNRKTLAQEGAGHQSPIAAYDEASDSVLMLDVAKFKYPPAWIKLADLLQSMQTVDSDSGKSRGLVVVEKVP